MLFGSCDCCDCACDKGVLPYAFTVEFSGLVNTTHTAYCNLAFTSNFGSGATGVAMTPGGCDSAEPCCTPSDRGPITSVLLTGGGSCYARCARAQPQVVITVDGVTGATFTPTFGTQVINGETYWYIASVSISGGTGFVEGETLATVVPAPGSYEYMPASIYLLYFDGSPPFFSWNEGQNGLFWGEDCSLPRVAANVTVTPCGGGYGAQISATVDTDPTSPTYGQITALTIIEGGENYLAWQKICRGWYSLNGIPFVLRALNPKRLVTLGFESCFGSGACATIDNVGAECVKVDNETGECVTANSDPACEGQWVEWDGTPSPIRSVTLVDGGGGYAKLGREQPQWTITQSGWTFAPTFSPAVNDECDLPRWPVASFSVASGSGATALDGWSLSHAVFSPEFSEKYTQAIVHTRQEPTVSAAAVGGAGASFTVSLDEIGGWPKTWRVASITGGGGSGYSNGVEVTLSVPERIGDFGHYTGSPATAIATVNNAGAITSIDVIDGGAYYLDNGIPQSVEVKDAGLYYRENPALTPYVASVNVAIEQIDGSAGYGAAISATVENDTGDQNFGKIKLLTIDDGGSNYSYFGGPANCEYFGGCRSGCGIGDPSVKLIFKGRGKPALVRLEDISDPLGPTSVAVFETEPVSDCGDLPAYATLMHGSPSGTVALTPGGAWDSRGQQGCEGCPCIAETDNWANQPISVTSDCPCKGGGTISGSGTIGNFNWNPCIVFSFNGVEVDIEGLAGVVAECEKYGCEETGNCQPCTSVGFYSYVYVDEGVIDNVVGTAPCTCDDLTVGEDGFLHGTVTIQAVGNLTACTVTIVFG